MDTITGRLTEKLRSLRYDDLPSQAVSMAKDVALDALAVILAGSREPLGLGRMSIDYVREGGGTPQSTVISGGFKTSMTQAAYVNGTLAHALDWDNTWYPLNHPTSPTLPAILAIAEFHHLPGKKIIEAIVAAFEIQGRLRLASTGLKNGQGFHKPGTTGTFGATAGAAHLLNLDAQQTMMAFGLAGSRAGSLAINTGTMTKSSHSGHAARMGVECALLAQKGWTASADVFGPKGFFDTFMNGDAQPDLLLDHFAEPLRMVDPGVGFKKYPSNYFTHRPIDAALALRQAHNIKADQIVSVDVMFPRFDYVNRPNPRTGLDSKFSIQYCTLVALIDGEVTIDTFDNARRFAADIEALLPSVKLHFDDSIPGDFDLTWVVVEVKLKDGRKFQNKMEKLSGWIGQPLTRQQRLAKFDACTRHILTPDAAHRMLELVENLEKLESICEVMDIARCDTNKPNK
jgi:2-methylcitrate dehydratase PrpD